MSLPISNYPRAVTLEKSKPDVQSLASVVVATVIGYLTAQLAFSLLALQCADVRGPRTEFAFHFLGSGAWAYFGSLLAAGAIAGKKPRTLWKYVVVGIVLIPLTNPPVAWSGPGDLYAGITPLLYAKPSLYLVSFLVAGLAHSSLNARTASKR